MMDRLLLCTDLDRTLLPNGPQPESEQARPLFARLAGQPQVTLVYVTGRDIGRVEQAIAEWNMPRPDLVLADVGTTIVSGRGSTWERWADWDAHLAADWVGLTVTDLQEILAPGPGLVLQHSSRQGRFKLSYDTPPGHEGEVLAETVRKKLEQAGVKANVIWSLDEPLNKGLLDILPRGATKFLAIEHVRRILGFGRGEVLFAGDSGNDLAVLSSPLPAVLVANARDEVRSRARDDAASRQLGDQLYCATGGVLGLNGNYAGGILEGVLHFYPGFGACLEDSP